MKPYINYCHRHLNTAHTIWHARAHSLAREWVLAMYLLLYKVLPQILHTLWGDTLSSGCECACVKFDTQTFLKLVKLSILCLQFIFLPIPLIRSHVTCTLCMHSPLCTYLLCEQWLLFTQSFDIAFSHSFIIIHKNRMYCSLSLCLSVPQLGSVMLIWGCQT